MTLNVQNKTPCKHRYKIYETNLLEAYKVLQELSKEPQYRTMQIALKDKGLMIDLAEIIDEYVICGVAADLGRCRPELEKKQATPPNLDEIIKLNEPIGVLNTFDDDKRIKKLYENYFSLFILADKVIQNGIETKGRTAFFERYPRIKHAVETVSTNFVKNIGEACQRLKNDWDIIHQYFFASNPAKSKLVKITPTGSDFHKGGKQVLILTFNIDKVEHKLVYKPGDIELDYRLLADTVLVRQNLLHSQELGNQKSIWELLGNQKSIWELTNEFLDDKFKLPTYKILPRSPGSKLDEIFNVSNRLPIEESYGYIEYLSHDPESDPYGKPTEMLVESDWVTSDKGDVEKFYRQWGRILAIAFVFSMSDIHLDNVIVHKRQPHLIDVEIAFTGPMEDVNGTIALRDRIGALHPSAQKSKKSQRKKQKDKTANLIVDFVAAEIVESPSKNYLLLESDGQYKSELISEYIVQLGRGYLEVLRAFNSNKDKLREWLTISDFNKIIARFTPMSTGEFSEILRQVYNPPFSSLNLTINEEPFITKKKEVDTKWERKAETGWPSPRPNYAIFTEEHVFKDYWNCDIPAFYHRLDEVDLLNARGEVVNVKNAPDGQAADHYFPESTLSFVKDSNGKGKLDSLDPIGMTEKFLEKFIPGHEGALSFIKNSS